MSQEVPNLFLTFIIVQHAPCARTTFFMLTVTTLYCEPLKQNLTDNIIQSIIIERHYHYSYVAIKPYGQAGLPLINRCQYPFTVLKCTYHSTTAADKLTTNCKHSLHMYVVLGGPSYCAIHLRPLEIEKTRV